MYFVRDISSMRYVPSGREKEFISYRNGMKWSYIAFERSENISHECERVYRQKALHLNLMPRNMEKQKILPLEGKVSAIADG